MGISFITIGIGLYVLNKITTQEDFYMTEFKRNYPHITGEKLESVLDVAQRMSDKTGCGIDMCLDHVMSVMEGGEWDE